jgi:hypothetical protein
MNSFRYFARATGVVLRRQENRENMALKWTMDMVSKLLKNKWKMGLAPRGV